MNNSKWIRLSLKTGGWLVFMLLSLGLSPAPPNHTSVSLISFTSNDHVIGFSSDGFYLSNGVYLFNATFIDPNPVSPQNDPTDSTNNSAASAASFSQVIYANLWPGINLHYDQGAGLLRSTYILASGANPDNIRLRYNVPAQANPDGSLSLKFNNGILSESRPIAWQEIDGQHIPVKVSFQLTNTDKVSSEVSFSLGDYDKNYPLWLDPTLTWNTFIGGTAADEGLAIAMDNNNHIYVAGSSASSWGSPVRAYQASIDGFVAQLDAITGSLIWHTFLGGIGTDKALDVVTDDNGNIYVTGYSNVSWGTPINTSSGGYDAFVARLDSSGSLIWNTFMGGSGTDRGWAIAADNNSNAYVTGVSNKKWGLPVRPYSGNTDAFVAKLNTNTGSLNWHTFLGGTAFDRGVAIIANGNGFVHMVGVSDGSWGSPVRSYANSNDVFAVRLNENTGSLTWNTFLGGTGFDEGTTMSLDDNGRVYIAGYSDASWGSPTRAYSSGFDAFVVRLETDGELGWNTFLGAAGEDFGRGVTMTGSGDIYVGGASTSTWGSPVRSYTSGTDAFIIRLDSNTGTLIWNTFLGGTGDDQGEDIVTDGEGNIFSVGTSSATWGSPVRTYNSGSDAFLANIPTPCIRSANSGLWSNSSSWEGNMIPTGTEGACIVEGHTITLDTSPQIGHLLLEKDSTLVMPLGFTLSSEKFVYNNGSIEQTQIVNNDNVSFVKISNMANTAVLYRGADVSSTNDLGAVTVRVRELVEEEYCTTEGDNSPSYAQRCYEISPTNNLPATVRLWSLLAELNGINVASLSVYRWVTPNWIELLTNRTTGTDGGSYAYAEGDTPGFSSFLLGQQGLGPTAVTLLPTTTTHNAPIILFTLLTLLSGLTILAWHKRKKTAN